MYVNPEYNTPRLSIRFFCVEFATIRPCNFPTSARVIRSVLPDLSVPPERIDRPGSDGEKQLQERVDTVERAEDFYESAILDHLNERMRSFLRKRRTIFVGCTNQRHATKIRVRNDDDVVDILGPDRVA